MPVTRVNGVGLYGEAQDDDPVVMVHASRGDQNNGAGGRMRGPCRTLPVRPRAAQSQRPPHASAINDRPPVAATIRGCDRGSILQPWSLSGDSPPCLSSYRARRKPPTSLSTGD